MCCCLCRLHCRRVPVFERLKEYSFVIVSLFGTGWRAEIFVVVVAELGRLGIFVNFRFYILNHRIFRYNCFFTPPRVIHQNTKSAAVRLARKASAEIIRIQHGVH